MSSVDLPCTILPTAMAEINHKQGIGADYFNYFIIGIEKVDGISLFLTNNGMSPYGKVQQWLLEGQNIEHVKTLRVCGIASESNQFDIDEWWRLDRVGIAPSEQYTVRESEAMRKYQGVINKYLEASFISKVKEPKIEGYYMPHFGIKKASRTTPLRIVFNASAKSKGHKSLNECLLPGPNLVEVAYHLLIKFRLNEYAMLADISKSFHRVLLDPRDAKYTRFLWREVAGRGLTIAFRVVVFGIMASPFLLQQVLNCHFEKEGRPDLAKTFYVDNYLSTFENVDSMRQEHESVNKILERAGMPLEGWASNNLAFDSKKQWSEPVNVNVLGLQWARDVNRLCVEESKRISELGKGWVPTKHRVLSLLVSIYDPLGLISPLFVRRKLFLQQLWEDNVSWDNVLRREKAREAGELLCELKAVSNITFPRAVGKKNLELHVFTDASSKAYSAVAYIRDNCNQVRLLTSKMRITPKGMNKLTIPKLELLALLLGCRLAKTLKGLIEPREIVMWTDNKVTMAWVASPDAKDNKNIFISNRVAEIIFLRQVCDFSLNYVPSNQNPADVLSRGATTQQLLQNPLWQKGPEFLSSTGEPVPYKEDDPTSVRTIVAAVQELREEIRPVPPGEIWELLQREVEFQFLLRVTRLILRFAKSKRDPFRIVAQLEQKYYLPTAYAYLEGEKCWSPGLRSIARQNVRQCLECVLAFQPLLRQPPPPPIPKERISLKKPFTAVGVDHTASIQTETRPGCILIVTCMASRAVYLDFCPSLEAEEFVLALRRFCATHGAPSFITSDNHQSFKTASNLLQGLYEEDKVQQFLRRTGIEWRFQTARAPWKCGFFERLIRVTKRTLQIALGKKYLPETHVLKLVKEAEVVVNNRPLMYSGDKCDDEVLTPSHLVRGLIVNLMAPILPDDDFNATFTSRRLRDRYLKLTDTLKAFREKWRKEYLSALRARHDCRSGEPSKLHPGDIVLIAPSDDDDGVGEETAVMVREDDGDGDVEDEGAYSLPVGLPGNVVMSGDNQEIVQATTSRQQATEVLGSNEGSRRNDGNESSDTNTVSESSERRNPEILSASAVESETSGGQGRSARPLRKAAAKQRELMKRLVENEDI
ncbi:uncharacterized protein [Palaemon carinicauda]|uniref:uncharacterized protein n=1 Tax=Palaemon carinicauda TaxID=392227 RepID=UPI0035B64FAB